MKSIKYLLIPVIVLCLLLTACKGKTPSDDGTAPSSEQAMENFLNKLEEGNYTMNVEGYLKTTAYSRDLVYFDYAEDDYTDQAVMSVNYETFQAALKNGGVENVRFLTEGQAIDVAKEKLVSSWLDLSEGNIWNLFYNDQEEPLKFVSYDDYLKDNVRKLVGNRETSLRLMHEVYLIMDKEDPTVVHIQSEVDDDVVARIDYDNIDIVITFGDAEGNAAAEAWMKDPVYPEARTGWTEDDAFIFNSVLMTNNGDEIIPFPSFASYALTNDGQNFLMEDEITLRDSHASEEDVQNYIASLLAAGFTEVKEKAQDGNELTYYRRMLREEYQCYASLAVDYDNGFNLKGRKYYDCPTYDDLAAVNELIKACGFPELPASDAITSVSATNRANATIESWLYLFDYDLALYVDIPCEDEAVLKAYLEDYSQALQNAGFYSTDKDETDTQEDAINLMKEANKPTNLKAMLGLEPDEMMATANEFADFRYHFEDGKVTLLFKAEHYYTPEETSAMIAAAGFPQITFHDNEYFSSRDMKKFVKVVRGKDAKSYVSVNQTFANTAEAETFLTELEAILNAAGYDRENPEVVGSRKQIAIVNPTQDMIVGIDLFEQLDGTGLVVLDFEAE